MQRHAILELDEGALTVTIGGCLGRTTAQESCRRQPLADWSRDSVAAALQPFAGDLALAGGRVHVILGDRRAQHFVATLPRMRTRDVEQYMLREALRLTSMPAAGEVLASARLVRRRGGRLVVAGVALPRSVWEPVRLVLAGLGLEVASVQTIETCLALATAPAGDERHAVVECAGGRARFVLCDGGCPVQVRRFMVGNAESNPEALAAQLAMELPRTLDWLRESGHAVPSVLVLGNRVDVDGDTIELLRGDMRLERSSSGASGERGFDAPSLATTALLHTLCGQRAPVSMSTEPRLVAPRSPWLPLLAAAAALFGCFLVWHGARDLGAAAEAERQLAEIERQNDLALQRIASATDVTHEAASGEDEQRLALALGRRRPISLLLAQVSEAATPDVLLDDLSFGSNERVFVSGVVRGSSRAAALALLADFGRRLGALPYLTAVGDEDIAELAGSPSHFRFRLGFDWRTS